MRWSPTLALVAAMAGLLLAAPGARAIELVQNGTFEGGEAAWVQEDNRGNAPICAPNVPGCGGLASSAYARSGVWWAWFGGWVSALTGSQHSKLHQTVTASAGTPLTLSFWLWTGQSTSKAALNVLLDDHVLFAMRGDDPRFGRGYVPVVVPIHGSLVTGRPQSLMFEFQSVPLGPLDLLGFAHAINVDDVSLQAPDIDLGVGLASTPTTVVRGSTFTTTIASGNAGPNGADDVWVEYPLPTGATLIGLTGDGSCSATETLPGHVMHCNFGTLGGGASKAVTATFRADAVGTVSQSATIAARTGDTNDANHAAQATVTVVAPTAPPADVPKKSPEPTCTKATRFTVPIRKGSKGTALMIGKYSTAKARILSARLTGPKKFKPRKLRHTRSKVTVDLRKLAAGRYTVRARVRVSSRKTLNVARTYRACGAKPSGKAADSGSAGKKVKKESKAKKAGTKPKKQAKDQKQATSKATQATTGKSAPAER